MTHEQGEHNQDRLAHHHRNQGRSCIKCQCHPKKITFEMKCQAFTKYHWGSMFSSCQLSKCKRFVAGLSVFLSVATRSSYCFGCLHFGISFDFSHRLGLCLGLRIKHKGHLETFSAHSLSQKIRILCKKTHFKCVKEVPSGIKL